MNRKIDGLHAITPEVALDNNLVAQVEQVIRGGARVIRYRNKSSDRTQKLRQGFLLLELCRAHDVLLLVNDDVELARRLKADGIHLGQDDMPVDAARRLLGPEAIIGASCYDNLHRALTARAAGADYLSFGAMFRPARQSVGRPVTHAPLGLLHDARQLKLPVVATGGISVENAARVIQAGADAISVQGGLFDSGNPYQSAQRLSALFGH